MGIVGTRVRIAIVVTLGLPQVVTGLWAVISPQHWFERFPGIDPRLVAAHPPYNEHLAADAGAGFLATGVTLLVAAAVGRALGIRIALLAYALLAVPHLAYHLANPAAGLSGGDDFLNLAMLAGGPALAALYAWRAEDADRSHRREEDNEHRHEEVAHRSGGSDERGGPVVGAGRSGA